MLKNNENNKLTDQIIEIHGLSHDGRGIGLDNNKTTFVSGALPTEKVKFKITQKKSNYNEAQLLEVLTPSDDRVTPACEHFGVCGGCSLQHMGDKLQLELKQKTLLEQLKHFGQVVPESILPPLSSESYGYRRKARLGVKFVIKKEKLLVGFREKSSRYLADLNRCLVLHPDVGQRFAELSTLVHSLSIYNQIPQIEVAIGDTQTALVFRHMSDLNDDDLTKLIDFGRHYNFHIYLQPNSPAKVHKLYPDDGQERLSYSLPDQNLEFLFHPLDFTQVNLPMNRQMVNQAIGLLNLQKSDKVLDLFCGIGNFSLAIARHADHVTGIEGDAEMVKRAKDNALHNCIANVTFDAANLMDPSASGPWAKARYDKILLDPPRAGAKEILPLLSTFAAKRIVYVSCNPATLARDAGELVNKYRYRLVQAGIMNMFPHTAHIEAMAVFDKL